MRISDGSSDVCSSDLQLLIAAVDGAVIGADRLSSAATGNSGYGLDIGEGAVVIMCVEQAQIAGNFHPIPGNCRRFQLKTCDLSVARIPDVLRRCPIDHRGDIALNVSLPAMENGDIGSQPFVQPSTEKRGGGKEIGNT